MSAPPALELTLLGPPRVSWEGKPMMVRPARLALLAYLVLEQPCSRAELMEVFYKREPPEGEEARARHFEQADGWLRTTLLRLRQSALGFALKTEGNWVSLTAHCDALEFQKALEAEDLERARPLFGPPLLEHLALKGGSKADLWREGKRGKWKERYGELLEPHLTKLISKGQLEAALSVARTRLDCLPYSEECCDTLVECLLALGLRGEAEGVQTRFREHLKEDLGQDAQLHPLPPLKPVSSGVPGDLQRPKLVVREALWARIQAWMRGPGGVMMLRGVAGVGKSRLAQECALARGGTSFILQGQESAQDLAYGALEPLLSRNHGRWTRVKAHWASELEALLPELGGTPREERRVQNSLSPVRQRKVLAEALLHLLSQGGLLVLEDLHWLDSASLDVVRHMLLEHPQAGPKVLATVRPGLERPEQAAWHRDLERAGALTALEVAPLIERETLILVRQLAGRPLPPRLARRLFERSGGNPYALLSLVRGLLEDGGLRLDSVGRWELHPGSSLEDTLPARASEALLRQLGTVPDPVWRLLESAALLGLEFDFEAAFAGSGLSDEDAALSALERLTAQHTVQDLNQGTHRYGFGHDLLRQSVAGRLSPTRGKRIHHRLAQHLERHGGRSGRIAHHWQAADDLERALPHWRAAAQEAARLHAHREALFSLEQALVCAPSALERLPLRFLQAGHLKSLADLEGWERALGAVETDLNTFEAHSISSEAREAYDLRLVLERNHLLWRAGKLEEALSYSAPYAEGPKQVWRGYLLHDRGAILNDLRRPDEARTVFQQALSHVDDGDALLRANLLNVLAQTVELPQGHQQGLDFAREALELFQTLEIPSGQASVWGSLGKLFKASGDLLAAVSAYEQAVATAQQAGHFNLQVWNLEALCELLEIRLDWEQGIMRANQALELCQGENFLEGQAEFEGWLERFRKLRPRRVLETSTSSA